MKALVLAAGRGSRLSHLTDHCPKCLVPVCGYPILSWTLKSLQAAGIQKIAIVGGYQYETLLKQADLLYIHPRWAETNMVQSLLCADEFLGEEDTLISYSDILYHPDIVQALMQASGDIVITYDLLWRTLWEERFSDPLLDAENFTQSNNYLLSIGARANRLEDIQGQFMGLIKCTPKGWGQIKAYVDTLPKETLDTLDTTSLLSRLLEQGIGIRTVGIEGCWCEIDSQSDLTLAEEKCKNQIGKWSHDWRFIPISLQDTGFVSFGSSDA